MRLGYFDGRPLYKPLGKENICTPENIEIAAEAARQGIVLLKNDNNALPLNTNNVKNQAIIGSSWQCYHTHDWKLRRYSCRYTSPFDGFAPFAKVKYAMGCSDVFCKDNSRIPAAAGYQTQLINQVAEIANGPVILVIMSAEGGRAIAEAVFGRYSPGGRLPITWYQADMVNQLPLTSMPLRPVGNYPGNIDGSDAVLVYSQPPKGIPGTHAKQVIGFQRVFVPKGQSVNLKFAFNACKNLGIVDYAANILMTSGRHTIIIGDTGVSFPLDVNLFC
ncbi:hypothetical protein Patl1_10164 [Pistacia atlantica]|uniref:Uncharacterized protein n=1 Tax=Pistacia atlantica TaxID=434234 RepID=A0ACC1A9Z5_9ROSI|nr:hypothetical protein Patl1_10164 [Pistacia atlantica]